MLIRFKKVKSSCLRALRAVPRSGFDRFEPAGERWVGSSSCRAQLGQPFQVPADTFELRFHPVGRLPQLRHAPITCAPLPPKQNSFNPTPDRTEQLVGPHGCRKQLLSTAGLEQNAVGHAVSPHHWLRALSLYALSAMTMTSSPWTTFLNFWLSCTLAAVSVTRRINVCISSTATCALYP